MNEREIAVEILRESLEKGFGNIVLRNSLGRHKGLSRVQKAFITETVNGTLRNLIKTDYVIGRFSSVKLNKIRPYVLNVLRISVYQIMFMTRVPASAACNEAVKLVKKKGFVNLSGYVNGVLRAVVRNIDKIPYPDKEKEPIKYISVTYSYPEEIIRYWLETYSADEILALCAENNKAPKVTAAVNSLRVTAEGLKYVLKQDNIVTSAAKTGEGLVTLSKTSDITESIAYKRGLFHIMDTNSCLCVKILDPKPGEKILDVCAAPGGKSFSAACLMKNRGSITARDIYPHKLRLMEKGSERLGTSIIKTELFNAAKLNEADIEKYDRVLVDAPCSGLGLLKKKPDIKYNRTLKDIEALAALQKQILTAAEKYVKPGGVLVYSTCTVSVKENEEIREWFLKSFGYDPCDIEGYIPVGVENSSFKEGYINITPFMWGGDGFFIAKFRKRLG
ncbi:MAG: 16S rRNA (cytosine(967)-C(5))-methyltransferase RsmB [Clostridiales bacterium]|nr:16S rRNA (cytosine(967)-C(5))-methyltransferase RsmB [Clostridiales bacterium]